MCKCINCGTHLEGSQKKYCSFSCENAYRGRKNREYYTLNPKKCKYCGEIIPYEKRMNDYCSSSCAAKENNKNRIVTEEQRQKISDSLKSYHENKKNLVDMIDEKAFMNIVNMSKTWKEIGLKLGYKDGMLNGNVKKKIMERSKLLGIELKIIKKESCKEKCKGELFKKRKNWQSARSAIQRNARKKFFKENPNPKCIICGYSNHVEVAHIKPVSEFEENAPIEEINDINNLIGLCPNHHWEYDNGILIL